MIRCKKCGQFKSIKKHICPIEVWNKGLRGVMPVPWNKGKKMTYKHGMLGKHHTEEAKLKNRLFHLGKKRSLESRIKQGNSIRGEKCHLWRGGISKLHRTERGLAMQTMKYKLWRASIFERDNYTCTNCGESGVRLEADHIKPWRDYPELRYDVSNGRTLCKVCHLKIGYNLFRQNNPQKGGFIKYNYGNKI